MNLMRSLTALSLVILVLASAGCAAVLVGGAAVGAVTYVQGQLKVTEKVDLDTAWDAAKETMQELGFPIVQESKDGLKGKLLAKKADGSNINIELEKRPNDVTEIRIRVGSFGDKKESEVILEEMRKKF